MNTHVQSQTQYSSILEIIEPKDEVNVYFYTKNPYMMQNACFFLVCECVYMCANIYLHVCTEHRLDSGVFHNHWLVYLLKQHLLLYPKVNDSLVLLASSAPRIPYIWLLSAAITEVGRTTIFLTLYTDAIQQATQPIKVPCS